MLSNQILWRLPPSSQLPPAEPFVWKSKASQLAESDDEEEEEEDEDGEEEEEEEENGETAGEGGGGGEQDGEGAELEGESGS